MLHGMLHRNAEKSAISEVVPVFCYSWPSILSLILLLISNNGSISLFDNVDEVEVDMEYQQQQQQLFWQLFVSTIVGTNSNSQDTECSQ
jgi:hypothetical protein